MIKRYVKSMWLNSVKKMSCMSKEYETDVRILCLWKRGKISRRDNGQQIRAVGSRECMRDRSGEGREIGRIGNVRGGRDKRSPS